MIRQLEKVIIYLKPKEEAGICLGDLLDFGKLFIAHEEELCRVKIK